MSQKFHQRFNIEIPLRDAMSRFVNRVHNEMFNGIFNHIARTTYATNRYAIERFVCSKLGIRYESPQTLTVLVGNCFHENLRAIESMYQHDEIRDMVEQAIEGIMSDSEIDLGIRWSRGQFIPTGAPVLDEKLINDVLGLTDAPLYAGVDKAFRKGLDHFVHSSKKAELLSDVITDMYEALEATAKIICGNDKDLSANRETIISRLKLSEHYKRMLKEHIEYANDLHRHAGEKGQVKPLPSRCEVEAFMYQTGLFIRIALSKET